jgi:hypothetical protein
VTQNLGLTSDNLVDICKDGVLFMPGEKSLFNDTCGRNKRIIKMAVLCSNKCYVA